MLSPLMAAASESEMSSSWSNGLLALTAARPNYRLKYQTKQQTGELEQGIRRRLRDLAGQMAPQRRLVGGTNGFEHREELRSRGLRNPGRRTPPIHSASIAGATQCGRYRLSTKRRRSGCREAVYGLKLAPRASWSSEAPPRRMSPSGAGPEGSRLRLHAIAGRLWLLARRWQLADTRPLPSQPGRTGTVRPASHNLSLPGRGAGYPPLPWSGLAPIALGE